MPNELIERLDTLSKLYDQRASNSGQFPNALIEAWPELRALALTALRSAPFDAAGLREDCAKAACPDCRNSTRNLYFDTEHRAWRHRLSDALAFFCKADAIRQTDLTPYLRERERSIACGASHPDPETERRFAALRQANDAPVGYDGCGAAMHWTFAYRCVECARYFHSDCIQKHFESHRSPKRPQPGAMAVPRVLHILAEWENRNGTLAAIMPHEHAALCAELSSAAMVESPRQARQTILAQLGEQQNAAGQTPCGSTQRERGLSQQSELHPPVSSAPGKISVEHVATQSAPAAPCTKFAPSQLSDTICQCGVPKFLHQDAPEPNSMHDLKRAAYVLATALLQSNIVLDDETRAAMDAGLALGKDRGVMFDEPNSTLPTPQRIRWLANSIEAGRLTDTNEVISALRTFADATDDAAPQGKSP